MAIQCNVNIVNGNVAIQPAISGRRGNQLWREMAGCRLWPAKAAAICQLASFNNGVISMCNEVINNRRNIWPIEENRNGV